MKRKHRFIVAGGLLTMLAVFVVGFLVSKPSGQSTADWWQDVAEVRSYRDFIEVVSGERVRERREAEARLVQFLNQIELMGGQRTRLRSTEIADVEGLFTYLQKDLPQPTTSPLFGGTPARNMANIIDKNIPTKWNVEEGKRQNVKWVAELGTQSYGGIVVADGKVFIGTTNGHPRDPKIKDKDKEAVLMAFDEATGKFLWQLVHDKSPVTSHGDIGLVSTPAVDGKRLYYITPACVVICADTDGKIQWTYDMMKELKVVPLHCAASSPLVVGDLVMVVTGNGTSEDGGKIASPKAPSFVAFNKSTGKIAWQSNLPGDNIIEAQWSNPTLATVNGKQQIIFPGGDGVLYSFEPETGKLIWKCDCLPTAKKKAGRDKVNYIVATPVVVGDRLYIGLGPEPDHAQRPRDSYFLCIDITKKGDVSPKSYDVKDGANKDSALVWAFGGPIMPAPPPRDRQVYIGTICATAAVHDGLVYVAEESGYLHCLDAKTGQRLWDHDFKAGVWGSPYYVDGRVYICTEDGECVIFEHGKAKKIIANVTLDETMHGTPVVAAGVLYISTKTKLYAIANGK